MNSQRATESFDSDIKTGSPEVKKRFCIDFDDVVAAGRLIKPFIVRTPTVQCSTLNQRSGFKVYLKAENLQRTGSFKYRGITNALELLKGEELKCAVTCSCGNQGQALAKVCQLRDVNSVVVVPAGSSRGKVDAMRSLGAEIVDGGPENRDHDNLVDEIHRERGAVRVCATFCPGIISGNGTVALEMLQDHPELDALVIPVGTGTLMAGMAIAAKQLRPSIRIFSAEPEKANSFFLSKRNGRRTDVDRDLETVAEGVGCDIAENTWPILEEFVEEAFVLGEEEIIEATKLIWERAKLVIEPVAGVAVAVVMSEAFAKVAKDEIKHVGLVLCGGNVDMSTVCKFYL